MVSTAGDQMSHRAESRDVGGRAGPADVAARSLARARQIAESVPDPELPMLTLADLGILRDVAADGDRDRKSVV